MILLYNKITNTKRYYSAGKFDKFAKADATQFKNIEEIYELVKTLNVNYDSLCDLGVEWVKYIITVKDQRLANTWFSLEEASKVRDELNDGLNKPIFEIEEDIFLDTFLIKELNCNG